MSKREQINDLDAVPVNLERRGKLSLVIAKRTEYPEKLPASFPVSVTASFGIGKAVD